MEEKKFIIIFIVLVLIILTSILSIVFGYVAKDAFVGMGTDFLSTALFQHPNHISLVEAEFGIYLRKDN